MSNAIGAYVARYINRFNLATVPTPPIRKGPRFPDWQKPESAFRDADHAREYYGLHPHDGVAAVLQHSHLVSIDIDHATRATLVFETLGIDLDALRREYPCIQSRPGRFRLMFKAPAEKLAPRVLRWPQQDDPKRFEVVVEFRAGLLADTLPPTVHPTTGKPYVWKTPPRDGFHELPPQLLTLWQNWADTERAGLSLCPWYVPPPMRPAQARKDRDPNSPSVIREFNKAHDLIALLSTYGYERRGKRFTKPKSSHAPGLVLLDDGRVFSHHAGDSLGDGKPHDSFDLFVTFDHGGDFRAAVKAAAKALGLGMRR